MTRARFCAFLVTWPNHPTTPTVGDARAVFCLFVTWPNHPTTPTGGWVGTRQIVPFRYMASPAYYPVAMLAQVRRWGMPCTEIGADWAAQRIKNLNLLTAVKNAFLGQRVGGAGRYRGAGGTGQHSFVVSALAGQAHPHWRLSDL